MAGTSRSHSGQMLVVCLAVANEIRVGWRATVGSRSPCDGGTDMNGRMKFTAYIDYENKLYTNASLDSQESEAHDGVNMTGIATAYIPRVAPALRLQETLC